MPKRIAITLGDRDWRATVSGGRITFDGDDQPVQVERRGHRIRVSLGDGQIEGNVVAAPDGIWVTLEGEVFVGVIRHGAAHLRRTGRDDAAFTPPMPATVVRIAVKPGDTVNEGDVLIALEAMKMELPIRAPREGIVKTINCGVGDLVQPDQVLLELE